MDSNGRALGPVLVTGAMGTLGRVVVTRLRSVGFPVRALSRRKRPPDDRIDWVVGDVTTGSGIGSAVDGIHTVVHLASAPYRRGYTRSVEIDGTRRLLDEAHVAGVQHIVYTSIIGCDRIPWAYFKTKVAAEELMARGPIPFSILRLGQFHDFVDRALSSLSGIGLLVADRKVLAQPVDTSDVAERMIAALRTGPTSGIEQFGGPEVLDLRIAARQWLTATGKRRPILPVRIPGRLGRAFRDGHLTAPAAPRGGRTWREYLAAKYAPDITR